MKILLILVDGMRPDAMVQNEIAKKFLERSVYTLNARTVFPSVTLPCHMSLFHSVEPSRHGILSNTYVPQADPVNGLYEVLSNANKSTAMFYNWEQLRDISRPGTVTFSTFAKGKTLGFAETNDLVTDAAIKTLSENDVDFAFLYLAYVDDAGHAFGWMGKEYMDAIENSWQNIEKIVSSLHDDYTVFITADHGGHDRTHGTELPEDMTTPLIITGSRMDFDLSDVNIKDIAPTITNLLGVSSDVEWEGKSLLK